MFVIQRLASRASAVALACMLTCQLSAQIPIPDEYKTGGFAIGCQAYTFHRFTVFEAIEKTAQAGGKVIEFFPGQRLSPERADVRWGHDASDEIIDLVKAHLKKHNLLAVNYGVVDIPADEARARRVFDFARKMGMRAITTESDRSIDTIEKLVKEYNIMVAFHNHPQRPNDPNYKVWDPHYIKALVENRDRRIGACADTGHWVRSGLKPVECLKILEGRIISSHLKDRISIPGHDVVYGTGISDIPGILDELKRQNFQGNISVEFEYNWDHSVPDVAQCIGFVRGYGTAKGW
jgi:sugar phosphate isomerase/epimerase